MLGLVCVALFIIELLGERYPFRIMETSRCHRIPRNGYRRVHPMGKSGSFSQNAAAQRESDANARNGRMPGFGQMPAGLNSRGRSEQQLRDTNKLRAAAVITSEDDSASDFT